MTITTYEIRNVLKVYGNQLKKRANLLDASVEPVQPSSDFVDISVEARRKQVLSQLSNKIISGLKKEPTESGNYGKELQSQYEGGTSAGENDE